MDAKWRTVQCFDCGGYGVEDGYDAGPQDCLGCNGGGRLYIRPGGHLFAYPGGPALGKTSPAEYDKGQPVAQEDTT